MSAPSESAATAGSGAAGGSARPLPRLPGRKRKAGDREGGAKATRPDVAARMKRRRELRTTTVKCGLATHLTDTGQPVLPVVEQAVRAITQISIEGSRLVNLLLVDLAERGQPLPNVTLTFIRRCFARCWAEAQPGRQDADGALIEHAWRLHRPAPELSGTPALASFPRGGGFGQILTYAAQDYLTTCQNHVRLNFWRRFSDVLRRRTRSVAPFLATKGHHKWWSNLVRIMVGATLTVAPADFDLAVLQQELVRALADID
ncbi:MAG: hypothetical protein KDA51_12445, partial [Planctomycetales bacterium]|nr:hypothetical protein [Planctomycetales bacterium]